MNEKHIFSPAYEAKKQAVLNALASETGVQPTRRASRVPIRVMVAAATVSLLALTVFAAAKLIDFAAEQEGYATHIHIALATTEGKTALETTAADTQKPLRAWNVGDSEIGIKLSFAYMPEDLIENTPYKWGAEEKTRHITFNGIDLRRGAWDTTIAQTTAYETFTAGEHAAYLIQKSDADLYNRELYVLFAEEELAVHAWLTYGITDEEIKAIAAGITLEENTDTESAIPIANEFGSGTPEVIEINRPTVYYDDLLTVGETGKHELGDCTVTLESVEYYDSFSKLNSEYIVRKEFVRKFTDEKGDLIPYPRTEYIRGDGVTTINRFGETEEMTKKLICITVSLTESERSVRNFSLYALSVDASGAVSAASDKTYVIDSTPGERAGSNEYVYFEPLGNGRYRLGYLPDADECDGELWLRSGLSAADYGVNFKIQ